MLILTKRISYEYIDLRKYVYLNITKHTINFGLFKYTYYRYRITNSSLSAYDVGEREILSVIRLKFEQYARLYIEAIKANEDPAKIERYLDSYFKI